MSPAKRRPLEATPSQTLAANESTDIAATADAPGTVVEIVSATVELPLPKATCWTKPTSSQARQIGG